MATLVKCQYARDEWDRAGSWTPYTGTYKKVWLVEVEEEDASLISVIFLGQATVAASDDAIDGWGDYYQYGGDADQGSFLQHITGKLRDPTESQTIWLIEGNFKPIEGGNSVAKIQEPNPLNWPIEYWLEWVEETEVVAEATCETDLEAVQRGPSYGNEPGPVVNAAGQETSEPLVEKKYRPVLCAMWRTNDLQDIIDVNLNYQGTTNDGEWFGAAEDTAKYLLSSAGRSKSIYVSGTGLVQFYEVTTKVAIKDENWLRKIQNVGYKYFKLVDLSDAGTATDVDGYVGADGQKSLFEARVKADEDSTEPDVPAAEPVNLKHDGTLDESNLGTIITWRTTSQADYTGIGIGGGP